MSKSEISIELTAQCLTLSPKGKKTSYSLIFLHGIGMSIQKFFDVFLCKEVIGLLQDFKIIVPQAPTRSIEMFGGKDGPSWFHYKYNDQVIPL
jgi:hypothetical protein